MFFNNLKTNQMKTLVNIFEKEVEKFFLVLWILFQKTQGQNLILVPQFILGYSTREMENRIPWGLRAASDWEIKQENEERQKRKRSRLRKFIEENSRQASHPISLENIDPKLLEKIEKFFQREERAEKIRLSIVQVDKALLLKKRMGFGTEEEEMILITASHEDKSVANWGADHSFSLPDFERVTLACDSNFIDLEVTLSRNIMEKTIKEKIRL